MDCVARRIIRETPGSCSARTIPIVVELSLTHQGTGVDGHTVELEVNLVRRHPFLDGAFGLGFSEDFLEHLDQGDQILFLTESYRTLEPGGILRLTFPELERVLAAHYAPYTYDTALRALNECYERHAHRSFPSRADIELMAHRVGFSEVRVLPGGTSPHPDLCGLEFRGGEGATHISVELVKSNP